MNTANNRERAIVWMRNNFNVIEMFESFALALRDRKRCFGINLLRERVRWECVYDRGAEEFKFPNDFSPYIARFLLWLHPELEGYLTCKLTQDEVDNVNLISGHDIWPNKFDPEDGPEILEPAE